MHHDFDNAPDGHERVRVFFTGSCEGLPNLREALEARPEL